MQCHAVTISHCHTAVVVVIVVVVLVVVVLRVYNIDTSVGIGTDTIIDC